MRSFVSALALTVLLAIAAACSHPQRLGAVPSKLTAEAEVAGMPGVRYWFDGNPEAMVPDLRRAIERDIAYHGTKPDGTLRDFQFLAISGGGDNGAFGAGLLVGWSETGTRPEFKVVTGISTGALTAPFAFLGPGYDQALREVYTTITPADVFRERPLTAALFDDAMSDNEPLYQMIGRHANEQMLRRIAYEYQEKGRFLLIATTDLDARRSVIWNIGKIAASGHPRALELFHRVLVASAAIPGVFPPVMIDVEAGGKSYQEMHVDGGTMAQVFLYPPSLRPGDLRQKFGVKGGERTLYVIRNARLDPDWASTERRTLDIAGRAIASLIQTQGIGDLYQLYMIAGRDKVDYNLAHIGADFRASHKEEFDPEFMNQLFDYGYRLGRAGYPWKKTPPGF
jgi:hypothetical protein